MLGSRLAVILLVAASAFGAGYLVARERHAGPPPRATRPHVEAPTTPLSESIRAALTRPNRVEGVRELAGILVDAPPESLPEVRAGFESVFLDVAELEIVLLVEWWADFDPGAAFVWSQQSHVANSALVIRSALRAWARRDPAAASEALGRILDPFIRGAVLDALVSGWDESGRSGLAEYLRRLPPTSDTLYALTALARRRVLRDGPEGAFRWAEALPEDPPDDVIQFKLQVFRRVASAAALSDPQQAGDWAARHSGGPHGDGLVGRVGIGWAQRDPVAAMGWLATLPAGKERDRGVYETYETWLNGQRRAAREWMQSAPLEPWLDPAVALYAMNASNREPLHALEWVERVQDPDRRRQTLVSVVRTWLENAPVEAQAWLAGTDLPDDVREEILRPVSGPPSGAGASRPLERRPGPP